MLPRNLDDAKNEKEPEHGSFVSVVYNIHSSLLAGGIKDDNPGKKKDSFLAFPVCSTVIGLSLVSAI